MTSEMRCAVDRTELYKRISEKRSSLQEKPLKEYPRPRRSSACLEGIALGLALLAILLGLGIVMSLQPVIQPQPKERIHRPRPTPTGVPSLPRSVDKTKLIIQQNSECWIGVPGVTCDPATRTYA